MISWKVTEGTDSRISRFSIDICDDTFWINRWFSYSILIFFSIRLRVWFWIAMLFCDVNITLFIAEIVLHKNVVHSFNEYHNPVKVFTLVAFQIPYVVETYLLPINHFLKETINGLALFSFVPTFPFHLKIHLFHDSRIIAW